jgi:SIR2-like domain
MAHNPQKFAANISAKLATRSRHVCAFLGAGVAKACGLPDVKDLQIRVLARLDQANRALFSTQLTQRNLEQALSRVRRIAALLKDSASATAEAIGSTPRPAPQETLEGLSATTAESLDELVCRAIVEELSISNANLNPMKDFAAWAGRCDYHTPLEIFTVNYDLLLETALEDQQVAYFDGFLGTLTARFRTELVEPLHGADCMPSFFTRLWKLHGSLNWAWDEKHKILRRGVTVENSAAIYPSDTKYDESRRMPFVVLQDRFRRALHHPETLTLVSGYSFGDDHLNEIIYDAASRRERSEIVVFCRSMIPNDLAEHALRTPNIQVATGNEAIIAGVRAEWEKPLADEYSTGIWRDDSCTLGDFTHLAAYLAKSVRRDIEDPLLVKLADLAATPGGTEAKAM